MKLFALEEFVSRRRGAQEKYAKALSAAVAEALQSRDFDRVLVVVSGQFRDAYKSDTDAPLNAAAFNRFVDQMGEALGRSTADSDVTATSMMLALNALNAAAVAAADADEMALELQWVDMADSSVRPTHHEADGQTRPAGEPFTVGGYPMDHPGDPKAPISEWINCRCVLRPVDPAERMALDLQAELLAEQFNDEATFMETTPEEVREVLVAAASDDAEPHTSLVVVALPAADHAVHGIGDEQKHVTLAYMGDFAGDEAAVHALVENTLAPAAPFTAAVSGSGQLGPDKAKVLFVEAPEIAGMRAALEGSEVTAPAMLSADAHPHFVPHMTIDYAEMPPEAEALTEVPFDRVAVWHGEQQTEYPLGLALPEAPPLAEVAAAVDPEVVPPVEDEPVETPADPNPRVDYDTDNAVTGPIPVHGVLAPEGVPSGDGRGFRENALSHRPLPLPGTYQSKTAEGHDDASLVFMIEKVQMIDGLQHWSGHMRTTPDADEALGVLVDFGGRFGLSVDADSAVGEYDDNDEVQWFSEARSSGAAMVNIPAFPEAYIALGPHPILDAEGAPVDAEPADPALLDPTDDGEALVAAGAFLFDAVQQFKDLAPGKTEDGPGWLTHPVDTDRLRDYWTHGEGAVKIGWGVPGDFNRCRTELAQYIKPEFLNGYCANRHYDALHIWPGQEAAATSLAASAVEGATMAPSLNLVAHGGWAAPSEWFERPADLEPGTGVIITSEGRTYGYIAQWGECHIGLPGACTAPPTSETDYGYFKTGLVPTREGGFAEVGQLTIGGGHADPRLGYRGATAHYDQTSSVWADVAAGEDEHGIWFSGSVRPNVSEDLLYAARASGRLSGDWREVHGNLELCAALSVNVPGFPIRKPTFAIQNGRQTALVAAGVVAEPEVAPEPNPGVGNLSEAAERRIVASILAALDERETVKTLISQIEGD